MKNYSHMERTVNNSQPDLRCFLSIHPGLFMLESGNLRNWGKPRWPLYQSTTTVYSSTGHVFPGRAFPDVPYCWNFFYFLRSIAL